MDLETVTVDLSLSLSLYLSLSLMRIVASSGTELCVRVSVGFLSLPPSSFHAFETGSDLAFPTWGGRRKCYDIGITACHHVWGGIQGILGGDSPLAYA